jgi:hypothetical protein
MSLTDFAPVSWSTSKHDETQRHLQGRRVGHGALLALLDVVFRLLEVVVHIFEQRGFGEILDREHGRKYRLQPLVETPAFGLHDLEKLVIRGLLHLDQIGHFRDFFDLAEELAKPLASREGESHSAILCLPGRPKWAACCQKR